MYASGTTNAFGNINIGLSDSDIIVRSVLAEPSSSHYIENITWSHNCTLHNAAAATREPVVNTYFEGTIYYLHFDV